MEVKPELENWEIVALEKNANSLKENQKTDVKLEAGSFGVDINMIANDEARITKTIAEQSWR